MGAWGHGHFENDSALDFMADVEDANNPKEALADAIESALDSDYLEVDEGSAAVVAAAYVDRQLNGTLFSAANQPSDLSIDTFPDRNPRVNLSKLRAKAVRALRRVLAADSELRELWEENEEDYSKWLHGIEQLLQRLDNSRQVNSAAP